VPTIFTHAFVGGALAAGAPRGIPRARLAMAAACVAVLPDLDVASFALGIPYPDPLGHRGFSHSLPFAAVSGVLAALLVARPDTPGWWRAAALLVLAAASHGLLDALTDGGLGVGLFVPFSDARFFFPWRPLSVSPIGAAAFFRGRASEVLLSELAWVWLPTAVLLALAARHRRARKGTP
jgi:inner membrane protein